MENLDILREEILNIDSQIIYLLADRLKISKEIGIIKKENNEEIQNKIVWEKGILFRQNIAKEIKLNNNFIERLYHIIHQESIRVQKEIND